jgi:L-2-hydroxyglutarate oxidase LhgO
MDEQFDVVVVGAGIVGLAVARELSRRGASTLVLERHARPIEETSSRNSGVIHSGIYYPTGSLKARFCVEGRRRLYEFMAQRGIAHQRCGKLIVAQPGQEQQLQALHQQALRNGVDDVVPLTGAQVRDYEPAVRSAAGLWCPSTGILDVHELAQALIADLEAAGGDIAYRTTASSIRRAGDTMRLACRSADDALEIDSRLVINCAGLAAAELLRSIEGYPAALLRKSWFAKGNYFTLTGARPFRHLVYPMPGEAGLGIHATLDLDGATRFGPNVEWVDTLHHDVDVRHLPEFYESIRSYWPGLEDGALQPGYAGIRPKLAGPGSKAADFVIEGPAHHGCAGLINLLGIESPGLTSCMTIAEYVADLGMPSVT